MTPLYSAKQHDLLAQVAAKLPAASRTEFHNLVAQQLVEVIAPLDHQVFDAARIALDRVRMIAAPTDTGA
jgi:hypothetical protein